MVWLAVTMICGKIKKKHISDSGLIGKRQRKGKI
jgi:hypothetical protein